MSEKYIDKPIDWPRKNSAKTTYSIKEFNGEVHLVNKLGEVITVNPEGSLSLLALGAQGKVAWEKAREKNEA